MFTGLVEEVGTVLDRVDEAGSSRFRIGVSRIDEDLGVGDSIAVSGSCLTVTAHGDGAFTADAVPETLSRTRLGRLTPGASVNLERSLRADSRLGGHIVQGHVDGVGTVVARTPVARGEDLEIEIPTQLARYVAEKGSVAVDGVSLTVTTVSGRRFGISLIPMTLATTTLDELTPGDLVNIEVDVLAKYVARLASA